MQYWQCDVIGCPEPAAWARAMQTDADSVADFLCNGCWMTLKAKHPEDAAGYTVCNPELATPVALSNCQCVQRNLCADVIVIV